VLRKRLVGTWTQQSKPNLTNTLTVALAFHADGTYSNGVTSVGGGATSSSYPTGDWAIQNGVLVRTVKRTSDPGIIAVGTKVRWTMEKVDDQQFIVKDTRNQTRRFERAK
jgi:hypothetical protein